MTSSKFDNDYHSKKNIGSLLIILLCCLAAYWPLSAGIFSLKNDIIVYFLPVRFQISDMIQHGEFPFWTPYINLGHPLYTDMQSGVWNPIVWVISLFGSYNMRTVQLEILFYIYLCGVNMFFLLKYFKINPSINLQVSICFMLCGFNSDTVQTLYWVSGMAFLPLVFLFFLKTLRDMSFKSSFCFGFTLYLLFSTGYPGEFIIIGYFLLSYSIFHTVKNKKDSVGILKKLLLSAFVFCLLSLPALMAYISGLSYISRGGGVSLELALTNSMHPYSNISYIFPLTAWKLPISETDVLGRNSYMGLFPFLLVLVSMLIKTKDSFLNFLKWVFVLSIILSLGKFGLLRSVVYYLPYMDSFRHPSMFRFISIFSGCIIAALILENILKNPEAFLLQKKSGFTILSSLIIISTVLLFLLSSTQSSAKLLPTSFTVDSLKAWLDNSNIRNWLILELLLQIPFMLLLYKCFIKKINLKILVTATVVNSIIHTILIQPITVVGTETVPSFQSKITSIRSPGFPLPDFDKTIAQVNREGNTHISRYGPPNVYSKTLGYQFYFITPGPLISHENFIAKENLYTAVFNFPILYRADTALNYSEIPSLPASKRFVLTEDLFLQKEINTQRPDSFFTKKMLRFSPNKWEFEISASEKGFFCLVQNYYPNWKLSVNGKEETIYQCNVALIGFKLQPGKNSVVLEFKDNKVLIAFYCQLIILILFIIFIGRLCILSIFKK